MDRFDFDGESIASRNNSREHPGYGRTMRFSHYFIMNIPTQHDGCLISQVLSSTILFAGSVLCLRLVWQGLLSRAPRWTLTPTAVPRLQARNWQTWDLRILLVAILLPTLLNLCSTAEQQPPVSWQSLTPVLIYYAVVVAGVCVAAHRTRMGVTAALGITRASLRPAIRAGILLGLTALPPVLLAAGLWEWLLCALGMPVNRQAVFDTLASSQLGPVAQGLLILLALVAAPVAEESLFRGVLLPFTLRHQRPLVALLLVNILFATLHLHLPSFLPLLTIGCCLSLGMLTTGSILTPIIMHTIFNGEMLLLFYAWPQLAS